MDDFVSAFNLFKDRKVMGKVTLELQKIKLKNEDNHL
jgi:hypothetical protein